MITVTQRNRNKPTHQDHKARSSSVFRKCFGTGYSHRLFDEKDPHEPRMSLGSICPQCSASLYHYGPAIKPPVKPESKPMVSAIPLLFALASIVPQPVV